MGTRTVLARFVGPPDETLKQIGIVIVMAARLDHQRMQMLENTAGVSVEDASKLQRDVLTEGVRDAPAPDMWSLHRPADMLVGRLGR